MKLGQHFLKNTSVLIKSARIACAYNTSVIIEIGPGHGELTTQLKAITSQTKSSTKIIAIEKDPRLAEELEKKFSAEQEMTIIRGDVLQKLPDVVATLSEEYVLVGNIPYYITGHLLRIISESIKIPKATVLVIQKEVAERIAAQPPKMNLLAAATQIWATPRIVCSISKKYFSPIPKVDSALIVLQKKDVLIPQMYYSAIRILFAHPRKTLFNNLCASLGKERATIIFSSLHLEKNLRPQNLSLPLIISIAKIMYNDSV